MYGRRYYFVTGGKDGQAIEKTSFYSQRGYEWRGYDLNVPRYYHACGVYNDPVENSDVNILLLSLIYQIVNMYILGCCGNRRNNYRWFIH